MPITRMPSGEYVNVAEGTSPERLQQIMQANRVPKRSTPASAMASRPAPVNGEQQEVAKRVQERKTSYKNSGWFGGLRDFATGYTSNFADEAAGGVGALVRGIPNAIAKGDIGEVGREYRVSRDVVRAEDKARHAQGGATGTIAEIAGALAAPVGTVLKGAKYGAEALGVAKALRGTKAASVAVRATKPVLARAALAGAGQGALNGAGQAEDDTLGGATSGALIGGAFGAAGGAAMNGAQRVAQVVRDRAPAAASRTAYSRIAELLSKAPTSPGASTMLTPERAARELAVANGRGTDAIVADLSPGLQAQAAKIARKPDLVGSTRMINNSEGRMAGRGQAMEDQIAGNIMPSTGTDALKFQQSNTAARKAAGAKDYDAALNKPVAWSPALDDFVKKDNPLVKAALSNAYRSLKSQDIDPTTIGLKFGRDGVLEKVERPTMAAFDYLKRGLDQVARAAKDGKDFDGARIAGDQTDTLRKLLGDVNPEYTKALATQRSFFNQDGAAELGKTVVKRLGGAKADPKVLIQDIQKVHPDDRDALRTGFADALIALRDQKTAGKGPVAVLQSIMRTPNQRKVLENLFEGKGNLGRFERWLNREMRASKTDAMVAGPQSITSLMAGTDTLPGGSAGKLAFDTVKGYAYGGAPGAVSAGVRSVQDLARGVGPAANEEIARILQGNGTDLVQGVRSAETFQRVRKAANRRRVVRAARGIQQPFSDEVGN